MSDKKQYRAKINDIITCLVFTISIFSITILSMTGRIRIFSENENRMLAQKPEFNFAGLFRGSYTSDYENYITDQFIYRDSFISIKTIAEASLMKSELNGVYLGKGGYLIEAYHPADVDPELMSKNEGRLIEFTEKYLWLLGEDKVKVMLVPTASDILSNRLPAFAEVFNQQEVISRVRGKLAASVFVNVSDALNNHLEEYIFYRTDHHWTTKGAYYAYKEWALQCGFVPKAEDEYQVEEASDEFRGTLYSKLNIDFVKPDSIFLYKEAREYQAEYNNDSNIKNGLYEMSHLGTKDKYSVFLDGNHALVKIDSETNNGRKLLIIKDSYANCFVPFATGHFESVYMMDLRYINVSISSFIEENEITDILFLYNVKNFVSEAALYKLTR